MKFNSLTLIRLFLPFLLVIGMTAEESIPAKARVFIAPMDGFETYLRAALQAKKIPLQVVDRREIADFEITGAADSQKAGLAKKAIMLDWRSKENASISVINLKTGVVAFAYSVHKPSSARGKRSSAEACAKHLGKRIVGG